MRLTYGPQKATLWAFLPFNTEYLQYANCFSWLRRCHFKLLQWENLLYLCQSLFVENTKTKTKNTGWGNMGPFLFLHQSLNVYLRFHPSVLCRPHLQPLSQSVSFCLPPADVLPLWLTLHWSLPLFSYLLLSNPCPHAPPRRVRPSSSRRGMKQARGERTREWGKDGEADCRHTPDWWWPVRKRRTIKWAGTEVWWDGEVASQLQSDIEEWGEWED